MYCCCIKPQQELVSGGETENVRPPDESVSVCRDDGTVVEGLTLSEWTKYRQRFSYLSEKELTDIRDLKAGRPFSKVMFEHFAGSHNDKKGSEVLHGIPATSASSLFMLLSVHVELVKRESSSFLSVYGDITSVSSGYDKNYMDGCYIYKREIEDVENFKSSDGYLTLNGPSSSCWAGNVGFLLQSRMLSIRLYDQQSQELFVDDNPIILEESDHYFEDVKKKTVQNREISITLSYISVPMAVYGLLYLSLLNWEQNSNLSEFVDVSGKVVANSQITFGNYKSQEIVLFDKKPDLQQYVRIDLRGGEENVLSSSGSRCWVVASACSLLHLHIVLYNRSGCVIFDQVVELETRDSYQSGKEFVVGKYLFSVAASWFSPSTLRSAQDRWYGRIYRSPEPCAPASSQPRTRTQSRPRPASAVEFFSVLLVCHMKPLRIHGRLRFITGSTNYNKRGNDIFKRGQDNPLVLNGSRLPTTPTISVFRCSRLLTDFDKLSLTCDLKDTVSESSIKGFDSLDLESCCGQQLCSIFQGDYGFAALHYAVFSSAVQVNMEVNFPQQRGMQRHVFGSICARYESFDYSSKYKKECYSIVLFDRKKEASAHIEEDGSITLSRPSFVVPSDSSVTLVWDLMVDTEKFSNTRDFASGSGRPTTEKVTVSGVEFVLKWSEVK